MIDFDEIYKTKIGEFGYWQKVIFISMGYICMPAAMQVVLVSFTQATPEFECSNLETSSGAENYRNLTSAEYSRCPSESFSTTCLQKCQTYNFSKTIYKSTLTEDFNLVCDREIYGILLKMVFFLGWSIGANFAGLLADNIGRKRAIQITSLTAFILDFYGHLLFQNFLVILI